MIEGQVLKKLINMGWQASSKKLTCPECLGTKQEAEMEKQGLRSPTREQKREIMDLLQDVYDTKAERYRGLETDQSVADTIGGGVLHGWVAQLREEFFGPNGNESQEVLTKEIAAWRATADELAKKLDAQFQQISKDLADFNDARAKVAEFSASLDRIRKTRTKA